MRCRAAAVFMFAFFCFALVPLKAQQKDKGNFIIYTNEFWQDIKKGIDDFEKKEKEPAKSFKMDFSGYDLPKSTNEFKQVWYNSPVSQGSSGMCWCFSTTSLLESESKRINGKDLKISELFTVYWEYVEKARRFVREHGESEFGEGSEADAVTRIWKQYGCVPGDAYTGMKPGQKFHNHEKMFGELNAYMNSLKTSHAWDEETAIANVKSIMNYYIGVPPATVNVNGKEMTPLDYLHNVVKINPDDYIDFMSLMEYPYYSKAEYKVPDNWWHSANYYNVPLDVFMSIVKNSIKNGYSTAIGGDVSESGMDSHAEVAMVPSYDIPSQYIDENARQFRFSNNTTTDDHGIHIVGWEEKDGKMWFLIKDSGSGARNGANKGFYFFHEDYIKLKMMCVMVHRSAVEDVLKKLK